MMPAGPLKLSHCSLQIAANTQMLLAGGWHPSTNFDKQTQDLQDRAEEAKEHQQIWL